VRLSLCIATFNEEKNLHYALDSTIEWVDEVVIVDGGSTDKTQELARSYGEKVRIIETSNPRIFHKNKQKAIDVAKGDWILQLDADEEVTARLKEEILSVVKAESSNSLSSGGQEANRNGTDVGRQLVTGHDFHHRKPFAYQIPRKNYFLGRFLLKGGVYPDYTIRLYRRGSMYFPCKDVHENVKPVQYPEHEAQSNEWLGTLQHPINHYSDPTFGRYLRRWVRYCQIEASRMQPMLETARQTKSPIEFALFRLKIIFNFLCVQPPYWFLKTYIRHKGFLDGWQGLVFHFMSALRWIGIAVRLLRS
jgi:glycosyltransferase involved in cell wall biosynthesis